MNRGRHHLTRILALALSMTLVLALAGTADAKKKKKQRAAPVVEITNSTPTPIADEAATGTPQIDGITRSTINVALAGKQNRGLRIRDANVILGISGVGTNSVSDLKAQVTAPDGSTSVLFFSGFSPGNLFGPATFDDETSTFLGSGVPPGNPVPLTLYAPWQGTVQPLGLPLSVMDNGLVQGVWTLTIRDDADGNINALNFWRIQLTTGRPFKTK